MLGVGRWRGKGSSSVAQVRVIPAALMVISPLTTFPAKALPKKKEEIEPICRVPLRDEKKILSNMIQEGNGECFLYDIYFTQYPVAN